MHRSFESSTTRHQVCYICITDRTGLTDIGSSVISLSTKKKKTPQTNKLPSTSDVTVDVVNSRTYSLTRKLNMISWRLMTRVLTTVETSFEDYLQRSGESTNKFGGREGEPL